MAFSVFQNTGDGTDIPDARSFAKIDNMFNNRALYLGDERDTCWGML